MNKRVNSQPDFRMRARPTITGGSATRHPVSACALFAIALLLGACSTQVAHPLLDDATETLATSIDLAAPPTVPASDAAPHTDEAPATHHETLAAAGASAAAGAADTDTDAQPPAETGAATVAADTPAADTKAADKKAENGVTLSTVSKAELAITVADVRAQAIGNNLEIKTELVRPAISQQERLEAEARFLPTAFARYTFSKFDQPAVPPVRTANGTTSEDAELGLQIPLQTGGSARISVPLTRTDFGVPGVQNIHDAATSFSLSQPLLRDAGRGVNIAPITIARLRERQQDANTKVAILNVLASADRFYWNLYAASRSVEVRLLQYERAKEQERQASRLSEEGVVPAIEVVRARAGVARRIEDIIRAENARRQIEREIKRAMNQTDLPVSGPTTLLVTTQPEPREIVIDRPAAVRTANDNRMELLALELQLAVDSLAVDVTRNQKLPSLALDYSFRYLGAANELSEALDQIGTTDFADQSVGLTLEVPLGNQARRARYHQAVLTRTLDIATREQRRQFIERQVLDTADQLDEAWQRILAAREETLLAARNFQAEQRQFIGGVRTSTDVLIAADFLAEAQVREINALAAYEIAKIDIAFVTGTLLGSGRVELASFDEENDLDAVAEQDTSAISVGEPRSPGAAQETISKKLDRLGVKAPSAGPGPGVPMTPGAPPLSGNPAAAPTLPATPTAPIPPAAPRSEPASAEPDDAARRDDAAPTRETTNPDASVIGPVGAEDTLWSLARTHRPSRDIGIARMMSALMAANPEQFPNADPGRLREGARLRLPSDAQLQQPAP